MDTSPFAQEAPSQNPGKIRANLPGTTVTGTIGRSTAHLFFLLCFSHQQFLLSSFNIVTVTVQFDGYLGKNEFRYKKTLPAFF